MEQTEALELEAAYLVARRKVFDYGVPAELVGEMDSALSAVRCHDRRSVLSQLVIGLVDDGSFPAFEAAIRTSDGGPYAVDECDHRYYASAAAYMRDEGHPEVSATFEQTARASLEHDLAS